MSIVNFKEGDRVVYPSHGVGSVIGEESQDVMGTSIKFYVISFEKDKMILKVPVNRAEASGLRPLSSEIIVKKAIKTLKSRPKPGRGMWSRRAQEYETKINSGDIVLIAEVVRDLHKNVDDPDRSYSERIIYEAALGRIAGEYSAVNDISIEESTENLVNILKASKKTVKLEVVEPVALDPFEDFEDNVAA